MHLSQLLQVLTSIQLQFLQSCDINVIVFGLFLDVHLIIPPNMTQATSSGAAAPPPLVARPPGPEAAINSFLSYAARFYRRLAASHFEPQNIDNLDGASHDRDFFTAHDLALLNDLFLTNGAQLDEWTEGGSSRPEWKGDHQTLMLADACWKVSQDLRLRLRQCSSTSDSDDGGSDFSAQLSTAFPTYDIEGLGTRLLELEDRWRRLQSNSGWVNPQAEFVLNDADLCLLQRSTVLPLDDSHSE